MDASERSEPSIAGAQHLDRHPRSIGQKIGARLPWRMIA
jgi:hypothetical protein